MELEPTRENLLKTLSEDILNRNKSVWQFAEFCDIQDDKCSIALDSEWGSGKTFFVHHVKLLFDSFNPNTQAVTEEEKANIQSALAKYIGKGKNETLLQSVVTVYYDAWQCDNDGDPILSLIYEIIKSTDHSYPFEKCPDCLSIASEIVNIFYGKNITNIIKLLRERKLISELEEKKEIHSLVEDFLESLLYEQGERLLIFIDELDRCKPEYAVRLLERIKHYFSNDRITFVFSVNMEELQHTVKRYYGEGFGAVKYLDRFFDYRIKLPPANMSRYYGIIGLNDRIEEYDYVCKSVIEYLGLSVREAEKFWRMANIAVYKYTHRGRNDVLDSETNALRFSLFVVPIIIGLRMTNLELYNSFINGKYSEPLISVLNNESIDRDMGYYLLDKTETLDDKPNGQCTTVLLTDKLNDAYKALFVSNEINTEEEIIIGKCTFTRQTKDDLMRIASMLSEFASFE